MKKSKFSDSQNIAILKAGRGWDTDPGAVPGARLACETIAISETCYRYEPKLSDENAEIADWLLRLT